MKNKFKVVFNYEFKKLVKSGGYIIATILGPFLIIAIMGISAFAGASAANMSSDKPVHIAFVAPEKANATYAVRDTLIAIGWQVEEASSTDGLDARVFADELDGYCVAGADNSYSWYSDDTGNMGLTSTLESIISESVINARLIEAGIDPALVHQLSEQTTLKTFKLSKEATDAEETDEGSEFLIKLLVPLCFAMLIYMSLLLYGQMIGRSVVTEKSSKIVDVLLSSVRSQDLLLGKLLGVGAGGLIQYSIWMLFGFIGIKVTNMLNINLSLPFMNFVWLAVFFLLGFVLYGLGYAAIGAACEDEQHMGELSYPLVIGLIIPIIFISNISQNPHSTFAVILSEIPLTSPMIMLTRMLQGGVPMWQLVLCIALLVATIWAMLKLSARIFRVGIMQSGKNFGFKDMKLWLTFKE